jgi:GNAT superfamily N-acetyltransferase
VAEIGRKVVGHIYGAIVNRAENEFNWSDSCLYIYQIDVDDDARRQGAGTALITFIRDRARALGVTRPCKSIIGHSMRAQETSRCSTSITLKRDGASRTIERT